LKYPFDRQRRGNLEIKSWYEKDDDIKMKSPVHCGIKDNSIFVGGLTNFNFYRCRKCNEVYKRIIKRRIYD